MVCKRSISGVLQLVSRIGAVGLCPYNETR